MTTLFFILLQVDQLIEPALSASPSNPIVYGLLVAVSYVISGLLWADNRALRKNTREDALEMGKVLAKVAEALKDNEDLSKEVRSMISEFDHFKSTIQAIANK